MDLAELIEDQENGALFSPCRRWRYLLWRRWDPELPICAFIGLNPSTADENVNDPTVRRCIGYARDWGYGTLLMLNLFAWRATDPHAMKLQGFNAVGPMNNEYLLRAARGADLVVAAWGTHGAHLLRSRDVRQMFAAAAIPLSVLKLTQDGHPGHPLYLKADLRPLPWLTTDDPFALSR